MDSKQANKKKPLFKNALQCIKPFLKLLPEVRNPLRTPGLREKVLWTLIAILVYLLASMIPLFGIVNFESPDPLGWMRIMMASNRGSLMDLGISPVVTASFIIQGLVGLGIVIPDYSVKEDKMLMDLLQKLIAIIITIGQAVLQIATGTYGPPGTMRFSSACLIFIQLFFTGIIVILLDEMIHKDYGLGNGVNLFIITNMCEHIVWSAISPKAFYTMRGLEFEGCFISAVHLLFTKTNKLSALYDLCFRMSLPNLSSIFASIFIFSFVVYLQAIRVEIPIVSTKYKGIASSYPINLLYTSTTPLIVQSYAISYFSTLSRFLFKYFPKNIIVRFMGVWDWQMFHGYVPVSGISYFLSPPQSFSDLVSRPIFSFVYLIVSLAISAFLCRSWSLTQEESPEMVMRRIKERDMQIRGLRDSAAVHKLKEYISTAAFLGGVITSGVILFCNIASTIGSGNNMFLAASIINQYIKLIAKESAKRSGKVFIE